MSSTDKFRNLEYTFHNCNIWKQIGKNEKTSTTVYLASSKVHNSSKTLDDVVVIKMLTKDCYNNDNNRQTNEIAILSRLQGDNNQNNNHNSNHPNIAKFFGWNEDAEHFYLITEYVQGGNLFEYLKQHQKLSQDESKFIISQVLKALAYCHSLNIIHRDVKLENVLLDNLSKFPKVKLTDFGYAMECCSSPNVLKDCPNIIENCCQTESINDIQYLENERKQQYPMVGSLPYICPEMIEEQKYDYKVDSWCCGIMTYELLHGKSPFSSVFSRILKDTPEYDIILSESCVSFISNLLSKNPNKRMSCEEALEKHPWIITV